MGKWQGIFKKKEKQLCPQCWTHSIVKTVYGLPAQKMPYATRKAVERYSLDCVVEYKCEKCGFLLRE